MRNHVKSTGFSAPAERALGRERRTAMVAELAAITGLAVCTIVAATAVTVGIAHASVADGVIGNEGNLFAVALGLGLIFIAIGGVSILPPRRRRHRH
jgi:hypothetical protein